MWTFRVHVAPISIVLVAWFAGSKFDPIDPNLTRQILHLSGLDKLESEVDLALQLIAYDACYENASRRPDGLKASGDVDGVADDRADRGHKEIARIDPDPKFHSARGRQRGVQARNVCLPDDSRFHRRARAVEQRHDTVADDLENASIHLLNAVSDNLQAILKLARGRDVVLLDQAGIADHVGGHNCVHPARVASAKLSGVLVAAARELDSKRNAVCDFDDVAIAQRARFSDWRPIDEGWVDRTEMGENEGLRPPLQLQMHSGYSWVADTNVAAGAATDRRLVLPQEVVRLFAPTLGLHRNQSGSRRERVR